MQPRALPPVPRTRESPHQDPADSCQGCFSQESKMSMKRDSHVVSCLSQEDPEQRCRVEVLAQDSPGTVSPARHTYSCHTETSPDGRSPGLLPQARAAQRCWPGHRRSREQFLGVGAVWRPHLLLGCWQYPATQEAPDIDSGFPGLRPEQLAGGFALGVLVQPVHICPGKMNRKRVPSPPPGTRVSLASCKYRE